VPEQAEATELDDPNEDLAHEQGEVQGSSKSQGSSSSLPAASSKDKSTAPLRTKRKLVLKKTEESDDDTLSSTDFAPPAKTSDPAPPLAKKARLDLFAAGFGCSS
jgi:hypothetical protein